MKTYFIQSNEMNSMKQKYTKQTDGSKRTTKEYNIDHRRKEYGEEGFLLSLLIKHGCDIYFSKIVKNQGDQKKYAKPSIEQIWLKKEKIFDKDEMMKIVKEKIKEEEGNEIRLKLLYYTNKEKINIMIDLLIERFNEKLFIKMKKWKKDGYETMKKSIIGYKEGKKEIDCYQIIENGINFYDNLRKMFDGQRDFKFDQRKWKNLNEQILLEKKENENDDSDTQIDQMEQEEQNEEMKKVEITQLNQIEEIHQNDQIKLLPQLPLIEEHQIQTNHNRSQNQSQQLIQPLKEKQHQQKPKEISSKSATERKIQQQRKQFGQEGFLVELLLKYGCEISFTKVMNGSQYTINYTKPRILEIRYKNERLLNRDELKDIVQRKMNENDIECDVKQYNYLHREENNQMVDILLNRFHCHLKIHDRVTHRNGKETTRKVVIGYENENEMITGFKIVEKGIVFFSNIKKLLEKQRYINITWNSYLQKIQELE